MWKANFDYEYQLFLQKPNPKINHEFEYLFFWTEDLSQILSTSNVYDQEYFDYLCDKRNATISLTTKPSTKNWWGSLDNIELEKKLNSKITSSTFAIENEYCHPQTKILHSVSEIPQNLEKDYLIKDPRLMAGNGFYNLNQIDTKKIQDLLSETSLIIEPKLQKIDDIGTYYFADQDEVVSYINLTNKQGNYKGTYLFWNEQELFMELTERGIDLDYFFHAQRRTIEHYLNLGAKAGFSIDSFTYLEEAKIKLYFLSEINYRKTMGWIALRLKKLFLKKMYGIFFLHELKNANLTFSEINLSLKKLDNSGLSFLLSPANRRFKTFFLQADSADKLENLIQTITLW